MKVKLKTAILDARGLHKKGDIIDVDVINPFIMEPVEEAKEAKAEPVEEAKEAKAEPIEDPKPKKTTKSKK